MNSALLNTERGDSEEEENYVIPENRISTLLNTGASTTGSEEFQDLTQIEFTTSQKGGKHAVLNGFR